MELTSAEPRTDVGQLIRQHQAGVWRYLRLLGCSAVEAEDLTQETFLVLLRRDFKQRGEAETWSYLRRTARLLFLEGCRKRARAREELRADLVDELWSAQPDHTGETWLDALRTCMASLQGRPRRVVRLFYEEGRPRAAVATAMDMKETGIKTLLQRTRALLRDCIRENLR